MKKKIYIILTHTGTVLSRLVKIYTHKEYSHVSIALDSNLNKMYSFGRLNAYNPFIGGFVHEGLDHGTFKRFKKTKTKIYALEIDEEQYKKLEEIIEYIKLRKDSYSFNFLGLVAVSLKIRIRRKRSFYCAEFLKYLFEQTRISYLPEIVKPEDFEKINGIKEVYKGFLLEYKANN